LVERRCGVDHPSSRCVPGAIVFDGVRNASDVQGGDKKQKRAVLLPPRVAAAKPGWVFPPVDFLFLKGAPRKRGSGGKTKAGETA